jgi:hemerythrin-like domain-containing protein
MLNAALVIIQDEHRSLAAVVHGLRHLVREMRERNVAPDFGLLWAMMFYLDEFPEKMHHPKEDAWIFARLRQRTHVADDVVMELERQHRAGAGRVRDLELALGHYQAGKPGGLESFSVTVETFAEEVTKHMALEEDTVIPLARKYFTAEDWVEIGAAFGENGDPRFDVETDRECRDIFSRIANLAPPARR